MGAKMKRTRHIRTDLQEYTYELARLENKKYQSSRAAGSHSLCIGAATGTVKRY